MIGKGDLEKLQGTMKLETLNGVSAAFENDNPVSINSARSVCAGKFSFG